MKIQSVKETDQRRAPAVPADSLILFDEPGRVFPKGMMSESYGLDCRSHWLRVTKSQHVGTILTLYVSHGGGEESTQWHAHKPVIEAMKAMDSDSRYLLLHEIHNLIGESAHLAALAKAESFIAGFEDDESQEGIPELLAEIRGAIAGELGPVPLRVKIEVLGGIADCTECPPGVLVDVVDHDNLEDEAGPDTTDGDEMPATLHTIRPGKETVTESFSDFGVGLERLRDLRRAFQDSEIITDHENGLGFIAQDGDSTVEYNLTGGA